MWLRHHSLLEISQVHPSRADHFIWGSSTKHGPAPGSLRCRPCLTEHLAPMTDLPLLHNSSTPVQCLTQSRLFKNVCWIEEVWLAGGNGKSYPLWLLEGSLQFNKHIWTIHCVPGVLLGTEDTQVNRISFLLLMSLELLKANQQGLFLIQNDCYCTRGRSKILCQKSSTWLYSQL